MKKIYFFVITAGLTFYTLCFTASAQSVFQKHFSDLIEYQNLSASSFDNTYIVGSSRRDENGYYDFCIAKMDTKGSVIWSKTFPSPDDDYLTSIAVTSSGDIVLGGYKLNNGDFDYSLMKLNAAGNLQWYKTYGTAGLDISVFTGVTSSGDIYISGNIETDKSMWVLKLNSSGAVLWNKIYSADMYASALTKEGGIAVIGGGYLMKINADGTIAWTTDIRLSSSLYFEGVSSLKQTEDGGYIFCSKSPHCVANFCTYRFAFMKIDTNGKVIWSKKEYDKYTGQCRDVVETADGGFVFTGQFSDSTGSKLVAIKTDAQGNHLWIKTYGRVDSNGEYACIEPAADGGFMLLGVEESKTVLIKADANGNTSCNDKILTPAFVAMGTSSGKATRTEKNVSGTEGTPVCTESSITLTDSLLCNPATSVDEIAHAECILYPNPFSNSTTLAMNGPVIGLDFTMYDVFGRKVMQLPVNSSRTLIARESIPSGMYFYELRSKEKLIGSGKIIAQ